MNAFAVFTSFTARAGPRSLTCTACRCQLLRSSKPAKQLGSLRNFASGRASFQGAGKRNQRPRRLVLYASSGAAAGIGALAFTDDIKSGYESVERTGRVAAALGICINEWVLST
jgi:aarF domain-containing kinase